MEEKSIEDYIPLQQRRDATQNPTITLLFLCIMLMDSQRRRWRQVLTNRPIKSTRGCYSVYVHAAAAPLWEVVTAGSLQLKITPFTTDEMRFGERRWKSKRPADKTLLFTGMTRRSNEGQMQGGGAIICSRVTPWIHHKRDNVAIYQLGRLFLGGTAMWQQEVIWWDTHKRVRPTKRRNGTSTW